jgi:hypothetical protein
MGNSDEGEMCKETTSKVVFACWAWLLALISMIHLVNGMNLIGNKGGKEKYCRAFLSFTK